MPAPCPSHRSTAASLVQKGSFHAMHACRANCEPHPRPAAEWVIGGQDTSGVPPGVGVTFAKDSGVLVPLLGEVRGW